MKRILLAFSIAIVAVLFMTKISFASVLPLQLSTDPGYVDTLLKPEPIPTVEAVVVPTPTPVEAPPVTWHDNPNGCNTDVQWIAAEAPFVCINKAKVQPADISAPSNNTVMATKKVYTKVTQQSASTVGLGRFLGLPYVYGAAGPNAFDCSGLTQYISRERGYNIPRSSAGQISGLRHISESEARYGDIVAFNRHHVGLYLGGGMVLQALNPSQGIKITTMADGIKYNGFLTFLAVGH